MTSPEPSPQPISSTTADTSSTEPYFTDLNFERQVQRLHQAMVYGRWSLVLLLWFVVAPFCLWDLRSEIALLRDYFTWTAVRYGIVYHRIAAFGLSLCIGFTVATLIWQSRNLLIGIPSAQRKQLEREVIRIRTQGKTHPFWNWICKP
ncbi:MAG TPA: hypothetical protein V6D10_24395 [Trichocoleus sp.]